jgi:uncharacterized protein YggT (Ycf19 family)
MFKLLNDLVNFIVGLVVVLLSVRFVLKLLSASTASAFVAWVYDTTQPLLQPFEFAFPTSAVRGGYIIEFTTLFALFAYVFGGYLVQEMLEVINRRKR